MVPRQNAPNKCQISAECNAKGVSSKYLLTLPGHCGSFTPTFTNMTDLWLIQWLKTDMLHCRKWSMSLMQTCHNFVAGIRIFKAKMCINPYHSPMH